MSKLKVNSDVLLKVLEPLTAVINPSHIMPILQCVKIEVSKTELHVTGDNHEVRCSNADSLTTLEEFEACVNFQMLMSALRTIKNQDITIKVNSKTMTIIHKQGDFELSLEDATTFPEAKDEKLKMKSQVKAVAFKKTLKIANKFVVNDDLEPMSNLSIEIGKNTTIRSTNKVSLFYEVIEGGGDPTKILLSGKSSTAIHTLMEDEDDFIQLKYNENMVSFKFGKKQVTVIQQAGNFPIEQFDKIIKNISTATPIELNKDGFLTSIRRVSTLSAKEKSQVVKMVITADNMNLSCDNVNSSSKVQEDLKIKTEKEVTIGFNSRLLVEVLSVFDKGAEFGIGASNMFCISEKKRKGLIAPILLNK